MKTIKKTIFLYARVYRYLFLKVFNRSFLLATQKLFHVILTKVRIHLIPHSGTKDLRSNISDLRSITTVILNLIQNLYLSKAKPICTYIYNYLLKYHHRTVKPNTVRLAKLLHLFLKALIAYSTHREELIKNNPRTRSFLKKARTAIRKTLTILRKVKQITNNFFNQLADKINPFLKRYSPPVYRYLHRARPAFKKTIYISMIFSLLFEIVSPIILYNTPQVQSSAVFEESNDRFLFITKNQTKFIAKFGSKENRKKHRVRFEVEKGSLEFSFQAGGSPVKPDEVLEEDLLDIFEETPTSEASPSESPTTPTATPSASPASSLISATPATSDLSSLGDLGNLEATPSATPTEIPTSTPVPNPTPKRSENPETSQNILKYLFKQAFAESQISPIASPTPSISDLSNPSDLLVPTEVRQLADEGGSDLVSSPSASLPAEASAKEGQTYEDWQKFLEKTSQEVATNSAEVQKIAAEVEKMQLETARLLGETHIEFAKHADLIQNNDIEPGIDISYETENDGLKEEIVLKDKNLALSKFLFTLKLEKVKPIFNNNGQWVFVPIKTNLEKDFDSQKVFYFDKPFMVDAKGVRSDSVQLDIISAKDTSGPNHLEGGPQGLLPGELTPTDSSEVEGSKQNSALQNSYQILLAADPAWLTDPARAYPIKIDPTVKVPETSIFANYPGGTRIGRKLPPPDLDLKNVSADLENTHDFEMEYPWAGMKVKISDKKDKTAGFKVVSGYDPAFWLELKLKDLKKDSKGEKNILKQKNPTIDKRLARFNIDDDLTVNYQIKDNFKIKADYLINQPLPDNSLEFDLDYPEIDLVPVKNENGDLEFHKANSKGEPLTFNLFTMEKPFAYDAESKEIPITMELSNKTLTLSLQPPTNATYPITIDPTTIDASAIAAATAYGSQMHILKDFNGSLIAVYMTTGNDIEAEWSNDAGATWSTDGPVVAITIANVAAAIDSLGNVHVVYEGPSSGMFYRKLTITRSGSSISSASFSDFVGLDNAAGKAFRPTVIVDTGNNLPAVAWSVQTTGGTAKTRIRFMRAKDDPTSLANWCDDDASTCGTAASASYCTITNGQCNDGSSLAISATNDKSVFHPLLLEMPSTGNLLLWWTDDDTDDLSRVMATRATDAAASRPSYKWTFSTSTIYTESLGIGTNSQTGFQLTGARDTANNRLVMAFDDSTTNNYTAVKYRNSSDSASTTSTDISPTTSAYGTEYSLAQGKWNGSDAYLLSYIASSNIALRPYISSWNSETVLTDTAATLAFPSLRLDSKSHAADQSSTTTTSSSDFGRADVTYAKLAQCFTAGQTGKISQVALNLDKNSAPVDGVVVELLNYDTGTSKPGSTVLADGGVGAFELTTSGAWLYVALNTSASITSGTKYCVGVRRLATADNTNNYSWYRGTTSTLANADGYLFDTAWSAAQSWDFAFYSYYESAADADKPKFDLVYTDTTNTDVLYHTWHINDTYSRTDNATPVALPSNANDLAVFADQLDYDYMATDDTNLTTITGSASSSNYNIFLFKKRNVSGTTIDTVTVTWTGQSSVACSATNATVYMKIYNSDAGTWDDFDSAQSNNTCLAATDFSFSSVTKTAAAGYYDSNKWVAIRVYQDAGEGSAYNLSTDRFSISFSTPTSSPVVQRSYLWEDDDGPDPNQNTAVTTADTDLTSVKKGERLNARFQLDTGAWTTRYKLQFGTTGTTCDAVGSWSDVTSSSAISMSYAISGNYGEPITSRKATANGNTRHDGYFMEYTPNATSEYLSPKYRLPASSYTEFVYAISTAGTTVNTKYCLRLYDDTYTFALTYTGNKYPALTIVDTTNNTTRYSKGSPASLASNTNDLTYPLDDKGYTAVSSDNSVRDFVKAALLKDSPPTLNTFGNTGLTGSDNPDSDYFGISVASAGDVNGDGYSDVIVGASSADDGSTGVDPNWKRGRAYIFFGGSSMNSTVDVVLRNTGLTGGDNPDSNYFGTSVASSGDVNGDGYSDVIVGAYWADDGGTIRGRAYIYFGRSDMETTSPDTTADVVLRNTGLTGSDDPDGDSFGTSVASSGDVNGDGYADVIVGASYAEDGGTIRGRAYIYFGRSDMETTSPDTTADVVLRNTGLTGSDDPDSDYFGSSVASSGDVNGDGYSDVIVGADSANDGGTTRGRAYIYFGRSDMETTSPDTTADVTLRNTGLTGSDNPNGDFFGTSVASSGDVNGDGYSDVIVGAYNAEDGGTQRGRAYIFFGRSDMETTSPDTTADVVLRNTGLTGSDNPNADFFGTSVASSGDVNGDGYSDVIVGADNAEDGGTIRGRAYTFYGGNLGFRNLGLTGSDDPAGDNFGYSVASSGDVNGDGYSDVIVGTYNAEDGGTTRGRAYIFFGGSPMDTTADVTLRNTGLTGSDNADADYFGFSVSGAGDVNGDGYSDVIVGAYFADDGGTNTSYRGRAYIYFGGSSMNSTVDVVLRTTGLTGSDNPDGDWFGYSVSSSGDVNGDGYSDVIVGADNANDGGTITGRAYIYFGRSDMETTSPDTTADVTLRNNGLTGSDSPASDRFGLSVSGAGDVNGDGYSDVIVGAYFARDGGTTRGRAYIYFGGSSMNSTVDVVLRPTGLTGSDNPDSDRFGYSVAGAGDVNGDGYSDVLVGADYADDGGTNTSYRGRTYVYFGRSDMETTSPDTTADVTLRNTGLTGSDNPDSDYFGRPVSSAGDVNGDGYSDVIVGAYNADDGGTNRGRAYIYFGRSDMQTTSPDTTADVTLRQTGPIVDNNPDSDRFGYSVSSTGDVNGDGYSDVIVGAYSASDGGKALVYFGGSSNTSSLPEFLFIKKNSNATDDITFAWNGSSSQESVSYLATSSINTLKLKVEAYDQSTSCDAGTGWEQIGNLAVVKHANVEQTITKTISTCPADYYSSNWVYLRISQTSTTGFLRTDNVAITFAAAAGGSPTLGQLLKHGLWFLNNVKQKFTF